MNMKQLYALLIILIVIYVGINVGANGLNILNSNDGNNTNNAVDGIAVGDSSFAKIDSFKATKINNTAVKLVDPSTNLTIQVEEIDSSSNVKSLYESQKEGSGITSSQEVDQNGVTAYFLYKEESDSYDTDIYFTKDNKNYLISGHNTTYENSDSFINTCKEIIDTMHENGNSDGKINRF